MMSQSLIPEINRRISSPDLMQLSDVVVASISSATSSPLLSMSKQSWKTTSNNANCSWEEDSMSSEQRRINPCSETDATEETIRHSSYHDVRRGSTTISSSRRQSLNCLSLLDDKNNEIYTSTTVTGLKKQQQQRQQEQNATSTTTGATATPLNVKTKTNTLKSTIRNKAQRGSIGGGGCLSNSMTSNAATSIKRNSIMNSPTRFFSKRRLSAPNLVRLASGDSNISSKEIESIKRRIKDQQQERQQQQQQVQPTRRRSSWKDDVVDLCTGAFNKRNNPSNSSRQRRDSGSIRLSSLIDLDQSNQTHEERVETVMDLLVKSEPQINRRGGRRKSLMSSLLDDDDDDDGNNSSDSNNNDCQYEDEKDESAACTKHVFCSTKLVKNIRMLHQETKHLERVLMLANAGRSSKTATTMRSRHTEETILEIIQKLIDCIEIIRNERNHEQNDGSTTNSADSSSSSSSTKEIIHLLLPNTLLQDLIQSTLKVMTIYTTKSKIQQKSCQLLGHVLSNTRLLLRSSTEIETIQHEVARQHGITIILSLMKSFNGIKQTLHKEALYVLSNVIMMSNTSSSSTSSSSNAFPSSPTLCIAQQFTINHGIQRVMDTMTQFYRCHDIIMYGLSILRYVLRNKHYNVSRDHLPCIIDLCIKTIKSNYKNQTILHHGLVLLYEYTKQQRTVVVLGSNSHSNNDVSIFNNDVTTKHLIVEDIMIQQNQLSTFLIQCMEQHIQCSIVQCLCCSLLTYMCRHSTIAHEQMINDDVTSIINVSLTVHSNNKCVQLEGTQALIFVYNNNGDNNNDKSERDHDSDEMDGIKNNVNNNNNTTGKVVSTTDGSTSTSNSKSSSSNSRMERRRSSSFLTSFINSSFDTDAEGCPNKDCF